MRKIMTDSPDIPLLGLDSGELGELVQKAGQPAYRAQQLLEAIYRKRVEGIDQIFTLPQQLRSRLAEDGYSIGQPAIEKRFVSTDGTVRYLMAFRDGQTVETVWMPEGDGGESGDGTEAGDSLENGSRNWDRATICLSSQVGCAVDCHFCLTALLGVKRNLTAGEIVGQVLAVIRDQKVSPPQDRVNLVFMGMGEPFLNYDNFMKAVRLLVQEVGLVESRMTVSTAGIIPRIHDFGLEPIRPKLAISLNASTEETRTRLMPINRKWSLEKLIAAARDFPLRNRERITFEYVLLDGVNDQIRDAEEVVALLHGLRCKVNLIALNPGPGIDFSTPNTDRVGVFQSVLMEAGVPTFVRRPRGR